MVRSNALFGKGGGEDGPDQDPKEGFRSRIWRGKIGSEIDIFFRKVQLPKCKEASRGPNLQKMTKSDLA